jgi:hypothetical protein
MRSDPGYYIVSTKIYTVDDGNNTVKIYTFIFACELSDLYCDWRRKGTSRSFDNDTSRVVFFFHKLHLSGKLPFNSSKASAILPT